MGEKNLMFFIYNNNDIFGNYKMINRFTKPFRYYTWAEKQRTSEHCLTKFKVKTNRTSKS